MEEKDFERIARHFIPDWIQWHEECRKQVIIAMSAVFDEVLAELDNTGQTYNWTIISERRTDGLRVTRKDYADSILRMAYHQKDVWSNEIVKAIYSDDISDLMVYNPEIGQEVTDAFAGNKWTITTVYWQDERVGCVNKKGEYKIFDASRFFV